MGCVMLHMELLRDLLSPQSRVKLSESPTEGVQLDGLHWQSITDVKEVRPRAPLPPAPRPATPRAPRPREHGGAEPARGHEGGRARRGPQRELGGGELQQERAGAGGDGASRVVSGCHPSEGGANNKLNLWIISI